MSSEFDVGNAESREWVDKSAALSGGLLLLTAVWAFIQYVVPPDRRHLPEWIHMSGETAIAAVVLIIGAAATFLFGYLKVHILYNDRFIGWKRRHVRDFILPRLLGPFRGQLLDTYETDIEKHIDDLRAALFDHFV